MVDTRQFASEGDKSLLGMEGALSANSILQNRYRIEGVLGVGGMGSVYQARDMQFPEAKRYVAVKEMLQQSSDPKTREQALRNFQREANILAGLNHPAIPTIHDYFSTKERAYLVMEFINGSDLDHVINNHLSPDNKLTLVEILEWMITLCDVLAYLHNSEPPIVFRDVKPSNLMIDVFGRLRLIDFGIAKHFNPESGKGTMIGTEGYAAPESYSGLASPLSDVFGVGATLHHILTGQDPRMEAPFTFAQRPIRDVNTDVPPALDQIVMKALTYDSKERFKSATEMKAALQSILHGGGAATPSIAVAAEEDGWGENVVGNTVEPVWAFKTEEEIRSTPNVYNGMVYVTAYDNNLYAIDAKVGQMKWKYPTDDVIASSPAINDIDGTVVFGSKDYTLYAVDAKTGRIKWSYDTQGSIYSSPVIDHGHIFFGSDDGSMYAVRASTGRLAWQHEVHMPLRSTPTVTDEKVIFGTPDGDLRCIDLSGQHKWRFKARREILSAPMIYEDLVIFGSLDGHVYAIGIENGWAAWKTQTNKPVIASPIGDGKGNIFIGSINGKMYCLDATSNGRERWAYDTESQIAGSAVYYNDSIYFGANNNKFYCLDAKSGDERWVYETDGIIPGSPTVADDTVFIGSADHKLYAFKA